MSYPSPAFDAGTVVASRRGRRVRRLAVSAAAITLPLFTLGTATSAAAVSGVPGSKPAVHLGALRHSGPGASIPIQYSGNWSGYVATPKTSGQTFNYVESQWTVPAVKCGVTPNTFSYHWVGLDGWLDGTVEQDGIAADCSGSTPTYFAWYEMFPAGLTVQFSVNPGDEIYAAVEYSGGLYYLYLADETTGSSFEPALACASTCNNSSAEVITEGYYYNSSYAGTTDFGQNNYVESQIGTPVLLHGRDVYAGLYFPKWFNTTESIAEGQSGNIDTDPGVLAGSTAPRTSAFPVYWENQN
jgi:hypothetical protein